jgi:hypothetical protein
MSKSCDTPHETNLYTEYLLVDAFEENDLSADFCFEDAFNHYFENYPLCTAPRFETRAPRY